MAISISNHIADFSSVGGNGTDTVVLSTAGVAIELRFARAVGKVTLQPKTNALQVAYTGTPGTTLGDAQHAQTADSIVDWEIYLNRADRTKPSVLYVEADASTTLVVSTHPRTV